MRLAFVIPWFHSSISGGAETQCREASLLLQQRGHDVTILTTCLGGHASDWNRNRFAAGLSMEGGLKVHRFPADTTDRRRFDELNGKYLAMNDGEKRRLPPEEEREFFSAMAPSSALLAYLERDSCRFDFVIFIPYLFATSLYGPACCGHKAVLLPCLHDEGYAYSGPVADAFAAAGAVIFNTEAEQGLARRILPGLPRHQAVIGDSISPDRCRGDGERFRRRFGIDEPFILCLGRRDRTKGTDRLLSYFLAHRRRTAHPVALVLAGPGNIRLPRHRDIYDLGFLDDSVKYDALAACSLLCNPSRNESFSIVLLEAWANARPTLVASACRPTSDLCRTSGGGLAFANFSEFSAAVDYLIGHPGEASLMGERGQCFTEERYSSSVIGRKYHETLAAWHTGKTPPPEEPSPLIQQGKYPIPSQHLPEPPLFDLTPPRNVLDRLRALLARMLVP